MATNYLLQVRGGRQVGKSAIIRLYADEFEARTSSPRTDIIRAKYGLTLAQGTQTYGTVSNGLHDDAS